MTKVCSLLQALAHYSLGLRAKPIPHLGSICGLRSPEASYKAGFCEEGKKRKKKKKRRLSGEE